MIGMNNLGWGLEMLALGMGTVFVLLFVLMVVLMAMGLLDRPGRAKLIRPGAAETIEAGETESGSSDTAWMTIADASGLTPEQIAAISVAVAMHADVRRKQGAAVNRVHSPGSRLWASRWVSMGRGAQMQNSRR